MILCRSLLEGALYDVLSASELKSQRDPDKFADWWKQFNERWQKTTYRQKWDWVKKGNLVSKEPKRNDALADKGFWVTQAGSEVVHRGNVSGEVIKDKERVSKEEARRALFDSREILQAMDERTMSDED